MRKHSAPARSCTYGKDCVKGMRGTAGTGHKPGPSRLNWSYRQTPLVSPHSPSGAAHGGLMRATAKGNFPVDDTGVFFNLTTEGGAINLPGGYGETFCKFPGGATTTISTGGCNRPCTEVHENVHFNDIKSCCAQANIEYFLAGSDQGKEKVKSTWHRWVEAVRPITECRAYDVSEPCLTKLLDAKKCQRESMTHDENECCGEIKLALDDDHAGQKKYSCDKTSRVMPPCPFGPSGPLAASPAPDSNAEQQPEQQPNEQLAHGRLRRS